MASSLRPRVLDYSGRANFNGLGIFYIVFLALYTIAIAAGLVGIFLHRRTAAIRIRGWKLTTLCIVFCHIYVAVVLCIYPENGAFKCGGEFWVMGRSTSLVLYCCYFLTRLEGIVFPLGLALFQGRYPKNFKEASSLMLLSCQHAVACLLHTATLSSSRESWSNHQCRLVVQPEPNGCSLETIRFFTEDLSRYYSSIHYSGR